jgi:hypothetical protein
MAEKNIVGGMFGISPEMYAMQRDIAGQQQAATLAAQPGTLMSPSLAPFYAQAAQQGQLLGKVTGSLLGVEDPELSKIRDVQSMRTQFDVSTPTGLRSFAQALGQKGYTDLAMQASQRAAEVDKTLAETQSKLRDQVKQVGLTTDGRQVYQSGANQFILTEQGPQPYYGKLESKTPKTTISMAGENEVSKVIGKGIGETQLKIAESGEAAAENLIKINETLTELKTGQAFTGQFADLQTNIAKAQAKFADDKKAGKKVTDTEYLDALLGSDVFPMISSLGIGARGLDTPAEREFLRKVMTGTIALERDTLIRLTETRKNIAERAVKKYNDKVESGELNKYFQLKGVEPKKIELPKATVATPEQAQQAPIYARNPSTNERIVSTDGGKTWNPVGGQ